MGTDKKPPSGVSALHLVALSPDKSSEVAVQAQARWAAEGILLPITASPSACAVCSWQGNLGLSRAGDAQGLHLCQSPL